MTEGIRDARVPMTRWVVIVALGVLALVLVGVAFAIAALPGRGTTYSDLPVVRMTSTTPTARATGSAAATRTASPAALASSATTPAPTRTSAVTKPRPAASPKPATTVSTPKTTGSGTPASPKGNTTEKRATEKKREVVNPEVRVEESDGHSGEGSSQH